MGLLAEPSRLDRCSKRLECGVGGKVRQVVFLLSGCPLFIDEPDVLLAGHSLDTTVDHAMPVVLCHPDTARRKQTGQFALGSVPPTDLLPFGTVA